MQRRAFVMSLAAGLAGPAALAAPQTDSDIVKGRKGGPNMIKGDPPRLDFGGGLVIPMNNSFFRVLWEGQDRWITYGRALSQHKVRAMETAENAALGSMKFLLLTLAFAPDRLERFEACGWRLKSGNLKDLVQGDIALPGRPVMPTTDEISNDQQAPSGGAVGEPSYRALTGYMVMKKDAPLDYVRSHAQLVAGTGPS